jgi:lysophospholipase L1-like esterase
MFSDQTVRMIVAPHFGGRRLRLHLSNRFGTATVTLSRIDVALRARRARIVPGTRRAVRFGGRLAIRIAPGKDVVSDPVRLRFSAFEELVVSIYVAGSIAQPTEHVITRQTNYLSPAGTGDHAGDGSGAAFTETSARGAASTGWYFLDGVDVLARPAVGAVVCLGDSITDGFVATNGPVVENPTGIDANGRYPDDLARRLLKAHRQLSVLNAGISGNQVLTGSGSVSGPNALARLQRDVIDQPGVRDVIVLEGINDIGQSRASAQRIIAGLKRIVTRLGRAGLHALLGTLSPAGGMILPSYGSAAANAERDRIDRWIRSQHMADVVDFDKAVRDPRHPSRIYPPYDDGDHLHLSLKGYRALAAAVNLAALR